MMESARNRGDGDWGHTAWLQGDCLLCHQPVHRPDPKYVIEDEAGNFARLCAPCETQVLAGLGTTWRRCSSCGTLTRNVLVGSDPATTQHTLCVGCEAPAAPLVYGDIPDPLEEE